MDQSGHGEGQAHPPQSPDVTVQVCDNRGRTGGGEVLAGTAEILDADGTERVRGLAANKYGIVGKLAIRGHKLLRGADRSVGIAITPRDTSEQ
ncbi:hypothetical protein [Nocardia sp. NPDC057440]|uniref:hypothetical protein n=1 Tax=Nocardia sp. NPDC057440 TaxID=3346134 RepID=UPI00366BB872